MAWAAAAFCLQLMAAVTVAAQADNPPPAVPEPLSLDQALALSAKHPRLAVTPDERLYPRRQPLFLGCHRLVFGDSRGVDPWRDTAWSPLLAPQPAQRLEVMQRFFDVLLADLSFARDNEAMAVAYVQFDRANARAELGQFSPLRVAELEAEYQLIRRQRAASEAAQRLTRSLLAQAIGRPKELPRELIAPERPAAPPRLPELEQVVDNALQHNDWLRRLRQEGGEAAGAVLAMEVRQQALELLTRLELLRVMAEQAHSESAWRDLKLDESRTLYELEAAADLGFSMSQQTRARRDEEQVAFCQALTMAELDALQGRPVR